MQGRSDRRQAVAGVSPVLHRRGRLAAYWADGALAHGRALLGMALLVGLLSAPASAVEVITNGSFETGNFNGWNVGIRPDRANGGAPSLFDTPNGWMVSKEAQTDGALSLSPPSGFAAFHGFAGSPDGLQFFLSQPFSCNNLVSRARLSFTFDVVGGPQADGAEPRRFEVWIRSISGHDRAKVFSYSVFGADANPRQQVSFDIRSAFNSLGPSIYLLEFRGVVPEGDTGPAIFVVDNVSLDLVDNRAPRVICPPDRTVECPGPLTTVTLTGSASDPDGDLPTLTWLRGNTVVGTGPTLTISLPLGTHTFTFVATDVFGAMGMCDVTVTIVDTEAPEINCPPNRTVECGTDTSPAATGTATATDLCSPPVTITHSDTFTPGTCPGTGTITRTWRAVDAVGNVATCPQIITIVDTTPPTLIGCPPSSLTVPSLDAVPSPPTVTATDLCSGPVAVQFTQTQTPTGPCGFTIVRTWKATDLCGNMATCTQTITVTGGPAGTIHCPPTPFLVITTNPAGDVVFFTIRLDPGVTGLKCVDERGREVTSGSFFRVGIHTVTCTALDACGNVVTCTFSFEVKC